MSFIGKFMDSNIGGRVHLNCNLDLMANAIGPGDPYEYDETTGRNVFEYEGERHFHLLCELHNRMVQLNIPEKHWKKHPEFRETLSKSDVVTVDMDGEFRHIDSTLMFFVHRIRRCVMVIPRHIILDKFLMKLEFVVLPQEDGLKADDHDHYYACVVRPLESYPNIRKGVPLNCTVNGFYYGKLAERFQGRETSMEILLDATLHFDNASVPNEMNIHAVRGIRLLTEEEMTIVPPAGIVPQADPVRDEFDAHIEASCAVLAESIRPGPAGGPPIAVSGASRTAEDILTLISGASDAPQTEIISLRTTPSADGASAARRHPAAAAAATAPATAPVMRAPAPANGATAQGSGTGQAAQTAQAAQASGTAQAAPAGGPPVPATPVLPARTQDAPARVAAKPVPEDPADARRKAIAENYRVSDIVAECFANAEACYIHKEAMSQLEALDGADDGRLNFSASIRKVNGVIKIVVNEARMLDS